MITRKIAVILVLSLALLVLFSSGAPAFQGMPTAGLIPPGMSITPPGSAAKYPCLPARTELGGRIWYPNPDVDLLQDSFRDIDFVNDLDFKRDFLIGEIYLSYRQPPTFALTLTGAMPLSELETSGAVLPDNFELEGRTFAAGTVVDAKASFYQARLEGVYYIAFDDFYRAGPYLMAELETGEFEMTDATDTRSKGGTGLLFGLGAEAEVIPTKGLYAKAKGAYTVGPRTTGIFADTELRFFPQLSGIGLPPLPGPGQVYLGAGYRYRSVYTRIDDTGRYIRGVAQGPYGAIGVLF